MTDEEKSLLKLAAGDTRAIRIGDTVMYPPVMVGGKSFQFDPYQNAFLFKLSEYNGDMAKACDFIGKPLEWAQKFVSTRKFREFRNAKLQAMAVRSGNILDWWWEMGLNGAKGFVEWYEGPCAICHEENRFTVSEAELFRTDDMKFKANCKVCLQPIEITHKEEEFHPTREQVQFWSEIGNRVSPKIERVQHEFSSENFQFVEGDAV